MPRLELLSWDEARPHASPVRFTVFVEEQGVPRDIELDEHDAVCLHAVVFEGEKPVATGRLLPDGHIGRLAVVKAWRGKGVGSALLKHFVALARERGHPIARLNAQTHAIPFYRAHGFAISGEVFDDAGIPHQEMSRRL